jgi:hypothetical protein
MRHVALQKGSMRAISTLADFSAASLSSSRRCGVQPFPLEGFDFLSDLYFSRASCPAFFHLRLREEPPAQPVPDKHRTNSSDLAFGSKIRRT